MDIVKPYIKYRIFEKTSSACVHFQKVGKNFRSAYFTRPQIRREILVLLCFAVLDPREASREGPKHPCHVHPA